MRRRGTGRVSRRLVPILACLAIVAAVAGRAMADDPELYGNFAGQLPCTDCSGIEEQLTATHPIRLSISQNTVEMTVKEDRGGILAVVGALAARGRVLRLEVSGASLEDIFVELTNGGRS